MARTRMDWKPRSSSMGYYLACDWRAFLDRSRALGELELDLTEEEDKPYADLGTVEHWIMQDGMRCKFPVSSEESRPTDRQIISASTLFGGDRDRLMVQARKTALKAATKMPVLPDGVFWHAELGMKRWAHSRGTCDFLASDYSWLVDLKTTTRPPAGKRMKPEHLGQLAMYYILIKRHRGKTPKKGMILYVDSMRAQWVLPCEIDFEDEEVQGYIGMVEDYAKYLRSRRLDTAAVPRVSPRCKDLFCPYYNMCYNAIVPPAGTYDATDITDEMPRGAPVRTLQEIANG